MKVCKKCKKQVANKTKICKYCGADVSKSKIIKQPNNQQKQNQNKELKKQEQIIEEKTIVKNVTTEMLIVDKKQKTQQIKNKEKKENKTTDRAKNKEKKATNETTELLIVDKKDKKKKLIKINLIDKIKNKKIKNLLLKLKKVNKKKLITTIILLVIGTALTISIVKLYRFINNTENTVIPNKENQNTVFNIEDTVTYKDVNYKVTKVETSTGTNLKRPKKGNEFVIVTLKIENRSDTKVKYSYKNWKMNNSLDEEKSRIFAPVNATTALYTGNLVIGGTKTGSMVFEQPIGDDQLRLNFYELEEPKEQKPNEEQSKEEAPTEENKKEPEKQKPIFTILIPQVSEKEKPNEELKEEAQKQ